MSLTRPAEPPLRCKRGLNAPQRLLELLQELRARRAAGQQHDGGDDDQTTHARSSFTTAYFHSNQRPLKKEPGKPVIGTIATLTPAKTTSV